MINRFGRQVPFLIAAVLLAHSLGLQKSPGQAQVGEQKTPASGNVQSALTGSPPQAPQVPASAQETASRQAPSKDSSSPSPGQLGQRTALQEAANRRAQELLQKVEELIRSAQWLATDIYHRVELLGFGYQAKGQYLLGPKYQMRLELTVELSDVTGRLLEVCDGRDQWHEESVLDVQKVEQLRMEDCRDILNNRDFDPKQRQTFLDLQGFTGPAPLVTALRDLFLYDSVTEDQWQGIPVYVLAGRWNEERLGQRRRPEESSSPVPASPAPATERFSLANLPPEVPTAVTVWVGREQPWIYRVELVAERAPKDRPTHVVLELSKPRINEPLDAKLFSYRPPKEVKVLDRTGLVVEQLQLVLQQMRAVKQATAASQAPARPSAPTGGGGLLGPVGRPTEPMPPSESQPKPAQPAPDGTAPSTKAPAAPPSKG
jgi:hypothetical protein